MKPEPAVLVIDDEPVVGEAVSRIGAAEGLAVDVATRAAAAWELLGRRSYRLILCDVMLGESDGFEFLAEAARRGLGAPVVMVTGFATVENAVRCLAAGAMDFLPKPFTADELMSVVRRGLRCGRRPSRPCPARYYRLGPVSWLSVEPEGTALVGVSDAFLKSLESLESVELAPAGAEVVQGGPCASLLCGEGLRHGVLCPVSGRIVEANAAAAEDCALVEKDPFLDGWLYRVLPSDLEYDLQRLTQGDRP